MKRFENYVLILPMTAITSLQDKRDISGGGAHKELVLSFTT